VNNIENLPNVQRLYTSLREHFTVSQWRTWEGLLALFLSVEEATHLKNVKTVSISSASRLLQNSRQTEKLKRCLWQFQAAALRHYAGGQGRTPWLVIRLDLTSIAKCGTKLPYLRTYNGVHGDSLGGDARKLG
jgi:hypothetical protein